MKTASTNKKIRELITLVKEGKLVPRPEFQRRLVWTHKDKDLFLDSIVRGLPFPEIYLADGDVDLETGEGTQLLVDGLQRVSTIVQYFEGSPDLKISAVPPYRDLGVDEKTAFLQYDVSVRDLGKVERSELVDVFRRLNATKYSLLDIEVNNAVYAGELKKYAEELAGDSFFIEHNVFNSRDFKRMGDLRYSLSLICTLIGGYFNRDDAFEEFLTRFNDEFPVRDEVNARIRACLDLIQECGFEPASRLWKKADLFSVLVELDVVLEESKKSPSPSALLKRLNGFFRKVEDARSDETGVADIYYKSALQASNDKASRIRRGVVMYGVLRGHSLEKIHESLAAKGLLEDE